MFLQCQLTFSHRDHQTHSFHQKKNRKTAGCSEHLSASAKAAWVQEGEDVEAEGSGQQAAEVCSLQGQPSAHADTQELELLHSTAQNRVLQHGLPLTVGPPEELQRP